MTAIVGITNGENVWIGGDSASVAGYRVHQIGEPKVFQNGNFLMGNTGSFRVAQLLQYAFRPPKFRESEQEWMEYMVTDFIDALRKLFHEKGIATKNNNEEEFPGAFMVGHKGHLAVVYCDYQVNLAGEGYAAVGAGEEFALGSLYSTGGVDEESGPSWTPVERIECALEAASVFSGAVMPPFHIVTDATP